MDALRIRTIAKSVASVAAVSLVGEVGHRVPHISQTAIALALLLAIELVAINMGLVEALVSTVAAAAELGYFFVEGHGWRNAERSEWVSLITFVVVAAITIRLSDQARTGTQEAAERAREMSLLHKFGVEMLPAENSTTTIDLGLIAAVHIFGIRGAAFRLSSTGEIFRAGPEGSTIPEDALENAAPLNQQDAGNCVILPIEGREGSLGTVGFCGARVSREILQAIGYRMGMSLERAMALEAGTEVEAARRCAELGSVVLDSLAHDLKTPLATMKVASASLASVQPAETETRALFLGVMEEELDHMDRVIGQVLHMGKLENGLFRLARAPQGVEALVASTLEEMGPTLQDRQIGLDIPEDTPAIYADLHLIKQVLRQLVENAIKYTPEGTPLCISSNQANGMVTIAVADQGPGVPEMEREFIFESYYRGQSYRNKNGGLGLGLAIAKRIVKAHGGQIWVTPNKVCGSVFHFAVPTPGMLAQ